MAKIWRALSSAAFMAIVAVGPVRAVTTTAFSSSTITSLNVGGVFTVLSPELEEAGVSVRASFGGISSSLTGSVAGGGFINVDQAHSGPGPFPDENDFSFRAGALLATPMEGARADATGHLSRPDAFPPQSNYKTVAEIVTNQANPAAGSASAVKFSSIDINLATTQALTFSFTDIYSLFATRESNGIFPQATLSARFTLTPHNPRGLGYESDFFFGRVECNAGGLSPDCSGSQTFRLETRPMAVGTYTMRYEIENAVTITPGVVVGIPEPGTYALLLAGLAALVVQTRRCKRLNL
jgi:hypothetical protein